MFINVHNNFTVHVVIMRKLLNLMKQNHQNVFLPFRVFPEIIHLIVLKKYFSGSDLSSNQVSLGNL